MWCDAISHLWLRSVVSLPEVKPVILKSVGVLQSIEKAEVGNNYCLPETDEALAYDGGLCYASLQSRPTESLD